MEQFNEQLKRLAEIYARLEIPPAIREWIDAAIAGAQGGRRSRASTLRSCCRWSPARRAFLGADLRLLPAPGLGLLPAQGPRPRCSRSFDRSLPPPGASTPGRSLRIVERVFGQWVRGQLHPRAHGRRLHVHRADAPQRHGRPDLRPVRRPAVDHRRHPRACCRSSDRSSPPFPAILLAATAGLEAVVAAFVLYLAGPAAREQPAGAEDPGRRRQAPPGRRSSSR